MPTNRRTWLKQTGLAGLGLGLSLRSLGNEEGLLRSYGMNKGLVNLGSNENPYGISPLARQAINEMMGEANRYQYNVPSLQSFRKQLAAYFGMESDHIAVTAGSGEGLNLMARFYHGKGNIVTANPTFAILPSRAKKLGTKVIEVPLTAEKVHDLPAMLSAITPETVLVYIVNPANPTATLLNADALRNFCMEASKKAAVLVDEAYIDFLDNPQKETMAGLIDKNPNVMVMGTFSKIHGMAGLRIGYILGQPSVIKSLEDRHFGSTQNCISNLSMAAAMASLTDKEHMKVSKLKNAAARDYTYNELRKMNFQCYPSYTNFLFFNMGKYPGDISQDMLAHNILVRSNTYADGKWCRVSVGTTDEMKLFISTLKSLAG